MIIIVNTIQMRQPMVIVTSCVTISTTTTKEVPVVAAVEEEEVRITVKFRVETMRREP